LNFFRWQVSIVRWSVRVGWGRCVGLAGSAGRGGGEACCWRPSRFPQTFPHIPISQPTLPSLSGLVVPLWSLRCMGRRIGT
jgi:hypothetical protein